MIKVYIVIQGKVVGDKNKKLKAKFFVFPPREEINSNSNPTQVGFLLLKINILEKIALLEYTVKVQN